MTETRIKPQRSFVDPFYKPEYKGAYFLSMLIGADALSLAILDIKSSTYLALEEYVFEGLQNNNQLSKEVEQVLNSSPLLKTTFEKSAVGYVNEHVSLIPEAFYDKEKTADLFQFTQGSKENHHIAEDGLINLKARNIYAVPNVLRTVINQYLPYSKQLHAYSSLIDGLLLKYKQVEGDALAIHMQYSHFELLHFKDGKLNYFNSFKYTTAEDFIYYVLFTAEQLELNPEVIPMELVGEVDSESNTYSLLYKYVRHITFGDRPKVLKYSTVLDVLPKNHFYTLFQQFLCV